VIAAPRDQARVLVVDDDHQIRELLGRLLERAGMSCDTAASAAEARAALRRSTPDLLLLDVYLPDDHGLALARDAAAHPARPAVLVISGEDDAGLARIALDAGAFGYVTKPFKRNEVTSAVSHALRRRRAEQDGDARRAVLEDAVVERTSAVHDALSRMHLAQEQTIARLSRAMELRDPGTEGHLERTGRISGILAERLGLDAEMVRTAGALHDLGKIAVPDAVLRKPGPLAPDERRLVERHPEVGHELLQGTRSATLDLAAEIAWTHHERCDGSGYPRGLVGEAIPLVGRVVAVADVFDAVTSHRPYRAAVPLDDALALIRDQRDGKLDPMVVDAFFDALDEILAVLEPSAATAEAAAADDEAPDDARFITLQEAAVTIGVSASTLRRWADHGRIDAVRTSGGHRRFTPDAVRRLAAERGPQPTVEPLPPPDEALPRLAERLCADGPTLRERVTASLYRNGTWGWFAGGTPPRWSTPGSPRRPTAPTEGASTARSRRWTP
jgi:excisionase family DNA binding protein